MRKTGKMHQCWSPASHEGYSLFDTLSDAIARGYSKAFYTRVHLAICVGIKVHIRNLNSARAAWASASANVIFVFAFTGIMVHDHKCANERLATSEELRERGDLAVSIFLLRIQSTELRLHGGYF